MPNPTPETVGQQHALAVEQKLLSSDPNSMKNAEEAFRQDYLTAMRSQNPDDQKAAEAERAALQKMDPSGYKLIMLELAKDTGVLTSDSQRRGEIGYTTLKAQMPNATAEDKLNGMVANEVLQNYDELTSGFRHDMSNLWSSGANSADANRVEAGLKDDVQKRQTAQAAEQIFLADNGKLLKRLTGEVDPKDISQKLLEDALKTDAEAKKNGGDRLFTDQQAQQVQWMADHWEDPAVKQLRSGDSAMWDKDHSFMNPLDHITSTFSNIKTGYQHAFGANFHGLWRPLNGVAGVADAALEGAYGLLTGHRPESYINQGAIANAVKANNVDAAGGGSPDQVSTPDQVNSPAKVTEKPQQNPDDKTTKHDPDDKPTKQDPDDKTSKQDPNDKPTSDADQDPDVVRKGEGYTYVATRLLGFATGDASTQDVEKAFQKLSKEQKAEVLSLSQALKESNKKKHNGVLWAGDRVNTDDPTVQAILNPNSEPPMDY